MAERKTEKKPRISQDSTNTNSSSTGLLDFFRFGESYTSLVLGVVVVIIAAILLVSFVKNRNIDQLTNTKPEISSTQTSRAEENASFPKTYTVVSGDDLWKIAEKNYNDGYQWVAIAKANNITNPSKINAGDKIQLPKVEEKTVIAQALPTNTPSVKPTNNPKPSLTPTKVSVTPSNITTSTKNDQSGNVAIRGASDMSPITSSSYTVVRGDNLWNIAERAYGNGHRWTEIATANNLANPRVIHAGNVLTIPR